MTFAQLGAALQNRGVSVPPPRSTANSRQALIDYGFTLEDEAAIQAHKRAESGSKPAPYTPKLTSSVVNAKNSKTRK
jgi:hypothetical protein